MKFRDTDLIMGVLIISVGIIFSGLGIKTNVSQNEIFDITYTIPQLKRFIPSFLLRDRNVIHTGLEKSRKPMAMGLKKKPSNTPKKEAAKAVAKTAKKNDKKTAKKESKKGLEVVKAENSKENDNLSGDSNANAHPPVAAGQGIGGGVSGKKSHNELYNEILNNPTRELMNEWVRLYQTKEVSKEEFYNLLADLVETKYDPSVQVALYGMAATPSFESFSQLAVGTEILDGQNRKLAENYLMSYTEPQHLKVIELALGSKESIVIEKAALLVADSAKKIKNRIASRHPNNDDSVRTLRGQSSQIPPKTFDRVLALLRDIEQSADNRVSQIASDSIHTIASILEG